MPSANVWELPEFAEIVRAEDANVEDVLRWAATAAATPDDRRHAQLIVACLWTYWFADGRLREGRERAESVLDTGVTGSYTEPGYHALVAAGEFARFSGDWADAEHLKRQAIQLTTDLQEKAGFLSDLGDVLDAQGRDAAALRAHDEAVALRGEIGHLGGLAHALINRGRTLLHAGHPAEAEQDTLAASAELDDLPLRTRSMFQSWVAAQLGEIAWYRRQPDLAAGRFREALRQATESYPDYPGVALLLGWIAAVTPDARTAARVLAMSDELRLQRGQPADNATVDAELRQRLAQELTDAERGAEREQALATGPTALIEELLAVAAVET